MRALLALSLVVALVVPAWAQRNDPEPEGKLLAKGKGWLVHQLADQVIHTDTATSKMKRLAGSHSWTNNTPVLTYGYSGIVAVDCDDERVYIAIGTVGRASRRDFTGAKTNAWTLKVFWLADGSLVHEHSLTRDEMQPATQKTLTLKDGAVTYQGLQLKFKGKAVVKAKPE